LRRSGLLGLASLAVADRPASGSGPRNLTIGSPARASVRILGPEPTEPASTRAEPIVRKLGLAPLGHGVTQLAHSFAVPAPKHEGGHASASQRTTRAANFGYFAGII
jgi:hypothetical protein